MPHRTVPAPRRRSPGGPHRACVRERSRAGVQNTGEFLQDRFTSPVSAAAETPTITALWPSKANRAVTAIGHDRSGPRAPARSDRYCEQTLRTAPTQL